MKNIFHSAIITLVLTLVSSCANLESTTPDYAISIVLDKTNLEMFEGESATLMATLESLSGNSSSVEWYSSDDEVAMVDSEGKVTANTGGKCYIIAKSTKGEIRDTCNVIVKDFFNLSFQGTANCYIVNHPGKYCFNGTVQGGSTESVGCPISAEVLWESFGTDVTPEIGDIIDSVSFSDGYVKLSTPDDLNNGNAVIAVKDASGTILWSWHIWVCEGFEPKETEQVYYKHAGTMMDRNLGATSTTKGDVQSLGLLYQWGRKDPFLGKASIGQQVVQQAVRAKSTILWPDSVSSNSSTGTVSYAIAHPTTSITENDINKDWYYSGDSTTNNTRWQISNETKGIYDPCPRGWRVPDGGSDGVWSKVLGTDSFFKISSGWDNLSDGIDFDKKFGAGTIWYPAGTYWSCTLCDRGAYALRFSLYTSWIGNVTIYPCEDYYMSSCNFVRCIAE